MLIPGGAFEEREHRDDFGAHFGESFRGGTSQDGPRQERENRQRERRISPRSDGLECGEDHGHVAVLQQAHEELGPKFAVARSNILHVLERLGGGRSKLRLLKADHAVQMYSPERSRFCIGGVRETSRCRGADSRLGVLERGLEPFEPGKARVGIGGGEDRGTPDFGIRMA